MGTAGLNKEVRMYVWMIVAIVSSCTPAYAEWYVAGDLLQARYAGPSVDGTWVQEQVPSRDGIPAVRQTKESLAWDVGVGYRFTGGESWATTLWLLEAGYRHYGAGVSAGGLAVSDEVYGRILEGRMPKRLDSAEYDATDRMQGGYLRVAKGFDAGYGIEPYLSGGVEVLSHDLTFWARSPNGSMGYGGYTGMVAGPTVGGGVKYAVWHGIKARVGAESHWMVTESGHPVSSQWITVGGGIEVPLTGWR